MEKWGKAVVDGYSPGLNISEEKLAELTGVLISNDVRIITESIDIAKMTNICRTCRSVKIRMPKQTPDGRI